MASRTAPPWASIAPPREKPTLLNHSTPRTLIKRMPAEMSTSSEEEAMQPLQTPKTTTSHGRKPLTGDPMSTGRRSFGRRRSMFFPPGFANKLTTFHDNAVGVTFQEGYEGLTSWQPPKVLKYDAARLFNGMTAWVALRTASFGATATRGLGYRIGAFALVAVVFMLLGHLCGANAQATLESLNNLVATGLIFILGPYVGLAVQRWWAVRKDGVGALWGAVDDLAVWSAAWFYKGTLADHAARGLVVRYGLLSHALLYKEARNEADQLDDVIAAGLLLDHEARTLQPLASKSAVVWTWMSHFWTRALANELNTTPIPHAAQLSPMVMAKCMQGRGAVGLTLMYIDSQQPFPYVHLLALLTDMALCVNSATVGLQTGRILLDYTSRAEVPLLLICAFVRVAVFVLIYSGLLAISVHLENPLGDDPADLPALAYQVWMKKECESFQSGVDAIDLEGVVDGRKWWEGLSKESDKKERSQ